MPCFHPIEGLRNLDGTIVFKRNSHYQTTIRLPCGRCIGCRLDRSKTWAIRLMHEAQLHERTAFITLTYDDYRQPGGLHTFGVARPPDPLTRTSRPTAAPSASGEESHGTLACNPEGTRVLVVPPRPLLSLNYKHCQQFIRALRKILRARRGLQGKIRFFMCGEYGEKLGRPHYHYALFGEDFREDRYEWRREQGSIYYRSPLLEKLWPHGNSEIGTLNIESAAYIARYCMKKINGKKADEHYRRTDSNGCDYWLKPEFAMMSRRPGIGADWLHAFQPDVYPHDYVIVGRHKLKPPRYYDKLLKLIDPAALEAIQARRIKNFDKADNTPARLAVREDCAKAKLAFKKRRMENQ